MPRSSPMRHRLTIALAFAACGIAGCRQEQSSPPRPNVLLVSIDSLRADGVRALGNDRETSPTIDGLAAEGALFRNAVSSSSWTIPSHMTMLTGMLAREHGVITPERRLRIETPTLADVLHGAGYATAGFVSGPTVRGVYGFSQGFESYDDDTIVAPNRLLSQKGITSPTVADLTTSWLDRWDQGKRERPFFLFVHFWDVHYDYEPPAPYDRMFDPDYTGTMTSDQFEMNPEVHAGMPRRDLEHLIALYDGEIRFTDEHLGRLIAKLRALGVLDDTIVVVTADHGDEFFEHDGKGHGSTLYDEVIRVPLVMRYPRRLQAELEVDSQVTLADIAPTILGLAGVAAPPGFGSRTRIEEVRALDLSPWLGDADRVAEIPDRVAIVELRKKLSALRTDDMKLIVRRPSKRPPQLYDLRADPGEGRNLLASGEDHPEQARLVALLDDWIAQNEALPAVSESWNPDEELTERLRALGYIKGNRPSKQERRARRRAAAQQEAPAAAVTE